MKKIDSEKWGLNNTNDSEDRKHQSLISIAKREIKVYIMRENETQDSLEESNL